MMYGDCSKRAAPPDGTCTVMSRCVVARRCGRGGPAGRGGAPVLQEMRVFEEGGVRLYYLFRIRNSRFLAGVPPYQLIEHSGGIRLL